MTSLSDLPLDALPIGEDDMVKAFDEVFMFMMRFTKKQILEESIHETAITPPQFGLLVCLHYQGSQNMKDLSDLMNLTHGAATGLVDRLHRLGLLERERSDADRRVVNVSISEAGQQLIKRIESRRHSILRKIIAQLTPEERRLFLKIDLLLKDKLMHHV